MKPRTPEEAEAEIAALREAAKPFAESVVIDPTKQRGDRHWATFGKPTNIDDIIALQAALNHPIGEGR